MKKQILSEENKTQLEKIMNIKWGAYLNDRSIHISTETVNNDVLATVTLKNSDNSFHYPVEARMSKTSLNSEGKEEALLLLDYIDIYFDEYFKDDENTFIPIDWKPYSYEGESIFMRGQIQNLLQEKNADDFIAQNS